MQYGLNLEAQFSDTWDGFAAVFTLLTFFVNTGAIAAITTDTITIKNMSSRTENPLRFFKSGFRMHTPILKY